MRFVVEDSKGNDVRGSGPNLWPIEPGESVTMVGAVPAAKGRGPTRSIGRFESIEFGGIGHAVEGTVAITVVRGTRIGHQG
jgi:hypothetical protein